MVNNPNRKAKPLEPIWTKPGWITAMVGVISVFLTVPEIIGNYYGKKQDIELAKEQTNAERIRNEGGKHDIAFKIVHNTLAQQGTERIFLLRYLAATFENEKTRLWAEQEVMRLDEYVKLKEQFNVIQSSLIEKEQQLKYVVQKLDESEKIEHEISKLKTELQSKNSRLNELELKSGLPGRTKQTYVKPIQENVSESKLQNLSISKDGQIFFDKEKVKKEFIATNINELQVDRCNIEKYENENEQSSFYATVEPNPSSYAWGRILFKENIKPHFYLTVDISAQEMMHTVELLGRDVYFLISPDFNAYMIWQSEDNKTPWIPTGLSIESRENSISIYQNGRNVQVFINDHFVQSFILTVQPSEGQVGLYLKANGTRGGNFIFKNLSMLTFL